MSLEKSIKPVTVVSATEGKDLHVHINLRLGGEEVAAVSGARSLTSERPPTADELNDFARRIYKARRARDDVFDSELFGEPAWDMLLALYCLPNCGERLTVTSLSLAANLPQTTGYRWQVVLAERGLLERVADERDGRRHFVQLTDKGRALLENYLTRLFCSGTLAPPHSELPTQD